MAFIVPFVGKNIVFHAGCLSEQPTKKRGKKHETNVLLDNKLILFAVMFVMQIVNYENLSKFIYFLEVVRVCLCVRGRGEDTTKWHSCIQSLLAFFIYFPNTNFFFVLLLFSFLFLLLLLSFFPFRIVDYGHNYL